MARIKSSNGSASKVSSSIAPASSAATTFANKSSILRSLFSPSSYQLTLFASVIQSIDSQDLRIHDVATGRLRCEPFASKATINCLDWGYYGEASRDRHIQESKKKRKRAETVNGSHKSNDAQDSVVAFGTSESEIQIFSATKAKIVGVLRGGHTQGIKDFKFSDASNSGQGWSIGGDGKAVQWDLRKCDSIRTITVPNHFGNTLCPLESSIICASRHTAYILNPNSTEPPPSFTATTNAIRSIIKPPSNSSQDSFLTAAESDHFISVFSIDSGKLIGSLRTENAIESMTLYSGVKDTGDVLGDTDVSSRILQPQDALAAVNKNGAVEIFLGPCLFGSTSSLTEPESLKSRAKNMTRKASLSIKVTRPDKSASNVPLIDASFQGSDIVLAWTEGGVNPIFDRVQWLNEQTGKPLFTGSKEIVKAKSGAGIGAVVMNGVKDMGKSHVDESRTVVANGGDAEDCHMTTGDLNIIDISSGEEESDFDEEMLPEPILKDASTEDVDVEMDGLGVGVDHGDEVQLGGEAKETVQAEEAEEPSFGDMIRANAPEIVDVQARLADSDAQALTTTGERGLSVPSGMSLGTVLTQSLRTNDVNLLETCFHVKDLNTVRATIERLDSLLATVLLQKLAERLHSRPGRAGSLMVWVQWTLVAHGGYLASQPEVMKKLASLHRVVKDRANSLQSLLSLKGKLDMLQAQMNMRKSVQARSRADNAIDADDEEGVIYVEGQEESDFEDDSAAVDTPMLAKNGRRNINLQDRDSNRSESDDEDQEGDDEEMPTATNGVNPDSEDEASGSDVVGFLDDEASLTDQDSGDAGSEDDIDHEDIDSIQSDVSSEPDAPPSKRPAKAKLSNGLGAKKR